MNVLYPLWKFNLKRFPSGIINKFKAKFCARGDHKLGGVDYFEIYAPVVQWDTFRLMLVLEVILDLKSKQGGITAAFMHAKVPKGINIYVAMPRGFTCKGEVFKYEIICMD